MHIKHNKCKDCKPESKNKGVTARTGDIIASLGFQALSQSNNVPIIDGIQNVKEDLQNVIELMGPSTPNLHQNTSSEADNEESVLSVYSSVKCDSKRSISDTPRDISQMSGLPHDEVIGGIFESCSCDNESYTRISLDHYITCPYNQYSTKMQKFDHDRNNFDANFANNVYQNTTEDIVQDKNVPNTQKSDENKRCSKEKIINFLNFLKMKRNSKEMTKEPLDLYKINILQTNDSNSPPKRVVFDLIDDIPRPETNTVATNTSIKNKLKYGIHSHGVPGPFQSMLVNHKVSEKNGTSEKETLYQKIFPSCSNNPTRVDVYYFDHGNAGYFRTTDSPPLLMTELLAEKTEMYTTKVWAQFFGTVHIGFAFFTSFILQFIRFFLQSFVRPLTVGVAQLASDYFFKPWLAVLFNAIVQPPLIFLYNIATSVRDLCDPLAEGIGYFLREIANICHAVRIVDVKYGNQCENPFKCQKKEKNKTNTIT